MVDAECVPKNFVGAVLYAHTDHDEDGVLETECKEKVRLHEFAQEYEYPKHEACCAGPFLKRRVACGEGLTGQILPALPTDAVTKHSTGRNKAKQRGDRRRNEKLHNADDQRYAIYRAPGIDDDNPYRRACGERKDAEQENESLGQMRRVVPGCWHDCKFGYRST